MGINRKNSKIFIAIVGVILASLIGWGAWVTNEIYSVAAEKSFSKERYDVICEDVKGIKKEVQEIRKDMKEQDQKANESQEKILRLLIDLGRKSR